MNDGTQNEKLLKTIIDDIVEREVYANGKENNSCSYYRFACGNTI